MQFDWFVSVLEQKWLENHEIYYIVALEIHTSRTSPRKEVPLMHINSISLNCTSLFRCKKRFDFKMLNLPFASIIILEAYLFHISIDTYKIQFWLRYLIFIWYLQNGNELSTFWQQLVFYHDFAKFMWEEWIQMIWQELARLAKLNN